MDVRLKALLTEPFRRGQSRLLPTQYCECDSVYLHDVLWRDEDTGPGFVLGDVNRSLRSIRLYEGLKEPVLDKVLIEDGPRRARRRLHQLRSRGAVTVVIQLVQANRTLFAPGEEDLPAVALFSLPVDAGMTLLSGLAHQLFEARDQPGTPPSSIANAVEMLRIGNTKGSEYHRRVRLHPEVSAGYEIYLADLWIPRPFLKQGYLDGSQLRCLAEPGDQGGIELLPWNAEEGSPVVLDPLWLSWNEGMIPKIAQNIAAERRLEDLPILADALEEAGCADQGLLDHLRQPRPHSGPCWVIDLLTENG